MKKLAERHPDRLLDLLNERLTFERAAVKLYDTMISKMIMAEDKTMLALLDRMREYCAHEKEHQQWLEARIRDLGGDAHGRTEMSELVAREAKGIEEVVATDNDLGHLFHALLVAELVDDSGWKLLLELADDADDGEARREFKRRAHEEERHLIFVRQAVSAFARRRVLDQAAPIAATP